MGNIAGSHVAENPWEITDRNARMGREADHDERFETRYHIGHDLPRGKDRLLDRSSTAVHVADIFSNRSRRSVPVVRGRERVRVVAAVAARDHLRPKAGT